VIRRLPEASPLPGSPIAQISSIADVLLIPETDLGLYEMEIVKTAFDPGKRSGIGSGCPEARPLAHRFMRN
jgi:hypothetical protein